MSSSARAQRLAITICKFVNKCEARTELFAVREALSFWRRDTAEAKKRVEVKKVDISRQERKGSEDKSIRLSLLGSASSQRINR